MRIRSIGLGMVGAVLLITSSAAQSPRERRELIVHPPPKPLPGQLSETVEPSRWQSLGTMVGPPKWGTVGGAGWTGVAPPPPEPQQR